MYIVLIALFVILIDRLTKLYIVNHFVLGQSMPVIDHIFHFTYILNRGAAFGILTNQRLFFLGVVLVLILGLIYYRKRISAFPLWGQLSVGLLIGGALGNGYDRFHQGAVIDFIDFRVWPIFNVADMAICIGVTLIILYLWRTNDAE